MSRAVLMFDGPPRRSRHCEGCPLFQAAKDAGDECPIWGDLYLEEKEPHRGCLCRADACVDNEGAVADESKRDSVFRALEAGQ